MSQIIYGGGCDAQEVPQHLCSDCGVVEKGRVSSTAFVHKRYIDTLKADPSNPQVWIDGIESGEIKIIPQTSGSFSQDPQTVTGYGRIQERLVGYNNTLSIKDPDYAINFDFYDAIGGSRDFHVAYATETLIHISDNPASIRPTQPVDDDLESEVTWNVEITWQQKNLVKPFPIPQGIFDCFLIQ